MATVSVKGLRSCVEDSRRMPCDIVAALYNDC